MLTSTSPSFFFPALTAVALALPLLGGCQAKPQAAAPIPEAAPALPLHWPTTPPPALQGADPELWVSLAAHLPDLRGQDPEPLVLEASSGSLTLISADGRRFEGSRFLVRWEQRPLAAPFTLERQVLGPFPSYESAEQQARAWRQLGAAAVVAHPDDWEVWAPAGSPAPPQPSRLVRQTHSSRWQPLLLQGTALIPLSGTLQIAAPNGLVWAGASYRGRFRLMSDAYGSWTLVHQVPVEDYLNGVVPHEIGAGSPTEALKAQAILARTWAVANQRRFRVDGYHLCSDTQCQVYRDPSLAGPTLRQALRSTASQVLTWQGKPVHGVYSASNGGVSAGLEEVWQADAQPYLKPVVDGDGQLRRELTLPLNSDAAVAEVLQQRGFHGEAHPRFRWSRSYSAAQLSDLSAAAEAEIGWVQGVKVLERGPSGRVLRLQLDGSSGSWILQRDQIRRRLRALPSTLFVVEPAGPERWRFIGGGFGHGSGLSQAGAIDLAWRGWSSGRILDHYFPGTRLQPLQSLAPVGSP